jgi:predicted Zn-dependent protease
MGEAVRRPYLSNFSVTRAAWALGLFLALPGARAAEVSYLTVARHEEAHALIAHRKYAEAAVMLRSVVREAPELVMPALDLSRALLYLGRREEAVALLSERAQRARGAERRLLQRRLQVAAGIFLTNATFQGYQEGVNFLLARKYRPARERFERALEKEADNVEILLRLAQCQLLEGDADSAVERLRLARKLNPLEPQIRLWLGRAMLLRGELAPGIEELRAAQKELKSSELAAVWLAEGLLRAGNRAAAIQLLEQDTRANPMNLLSLVALARHRLGLQPRDEEGLWTIRRELQLALSRLPQYGSVSDRIENELALDLRDPAALRKEIDSLLAKVEQGIDTQAES